MKRPFETTFFQALVPDHQAVAIPVHGFEPVTGFARRQEQMADVESGDLTLDSPQEDIVIRFGAGGIYMPVAGCELRYSGASQPFAINYYLQIILAQSRKVVVQRMQ